MTPAATLTRPALRPLTEIRDDVINTEGVIEMLSRIRDGETGHMRFRYGRVVEEAEARLAEFRAELARMEDGR